MSIEAMKQALEALESCTPADTSTGHVVWPSYDEQAVAQAITALRTAIEQAEKQEPVAWINAEKRTFEWNGPVLWNTPTVAVLDKIPLYTTPPAAQRRIEELEAMLERQTARIVDLQTHIENLEGEE